MPAQVFGLRYAPTSRSCHDQRIEAGPRMSEASIHNGVIYLAGQVADDASVDIETQTRQVLAAIDALLAAAGSDKTRILRAQIYLADIGDFAGMNRAWDAWVVPGNAPSRATVEARLAKSEWKVEIVVTAAV
ncbi:RidA family protein [Rudaea sp.]|uniref:RidA family protein n=1 Tax=Rudaea sp. TaxID=2136325 RepID=UPI002ED03CB0